MRENPLANHSNVLFDVLWRTSDIINGNLSLIISISFSVLYDDSDILSALRETLPELI
ncbi:MAG: hypothetical protein LBT16_04925 [Treponema sp.]|jgi:hypothetical protein|nr:hypothetical protein [Treponema sp.]